MEKDPIGDAKEDTAITIKGMSKLLPISNVMFAKNLVIRLKIVDITALSVKS